MIDCLIDCLKVGEIRNFLKVKWEGIKGLSQTLILAFWSPWIQILFKYKTLERRWHDFFHLYKMKRVFEKYLNSIRKYFPLQKLYATQWFSREEINDFFKLWNMSWEFQGSNSKSFWNYFQFGVIWLLFKLFFSKNKIHGK